MMVSNKGRYALRVMIDLAKHNTGGFISLKDMSERQDISRKYLESIMSGLSKHNLVESAMGKDGGYRLNRNPDEYKVGEILRVTEGDLSPVACIAKDEKKCEMTSLCNAFPFWQGLASRINEYIDSYTLKDFLDEDAKAKNSD